MLTVALAALPDPWLTGVWLPIIGILSTVFLGIAAIAIAVRSNRKDLQRTDRKERSEFATGVEGLFTQYDSATIKALNTRAAVLTPPANNIVKWVQNHMTLIGAPWGAISTGVFGMAADNRMHVLQSETTKRLKVWVETGVFDSGMVELPNLIN